MTEKRFETNMRLVIDTEKKYGARVLNAEEVVDLLNEGMEVVIVDNLVNSKIDVLLKIKK